MDLINITKSRFRMRSPMCFTTISQNVQTQWADNLRRYRPTTATNRILRHMQFTKTRHWKRTCLPGVSWKMKLKPGHRYLPGKPVKHEYRTAMAFATRSTFLKVSMQRNVSAVLLMAKATMNHRSLHCYVLWLIYSSEKRHRSLQNLFPVNNTTSKSKLS